MASTRVFTVTLIRHAKTIYPKGTLPPYDPDIDLSDQDRIRQTASLIPSQADWWISPLSRCQKTAKALVSAGANPKSQMTEDQLFEQNYGDWHGMDIADIWAQIEDLQKTNWFFLHPEITPPNGESFVDVINRITPIIAMISAYKGQHLVLVCHAMVIRAMLGVMMGLDPDRSLALQIDPLSATQLTFMAEGSQNHALDGGAWMLNFLNK